MSSNVFLHPSAEFVSADALLEDGRNQRLKSVVIIGWCEDGSMHFASNETVANSAFLLRKAEHRLFDAVRKIEDATVA